MSYDPGVRMKALTIALHCCVLNDALINIVESKDSIKLGTQPELFKLTTELRGDFHQLALALKFVNHWHTHTNLSQPESRLYDYDALQVLDSMCRMYKKIKFDDMSNLMEKISKENFPADLHPTIKFISSLNGHALWIHNSGRCI